MKSTLRRADCKGREGKNLLSCWDQMASHLYEIKVFIVDWRDGSGAESIDCSSRGLKFRSQHPHVGSEPSLTLSLGHPVLSSDLCENQAHMWNTCINAGKAPIHRKQSKSSKSLYCFFFLARGSLCWPAHRPGERQVNSWHWKIAFLLLDLAATNSDDRILSLYIVPLVLALWGVSQVRLHLSAEKEAQTLWAG